MSNSLVKNALVLPHSWSAPVVAAWVHEYFIVQELLPLTGSLLPTLSLCPSRPLTWRRKSPVSFAIPFQPSSRDIAIGCNIFGFKDYGLTKYAQIQNCAQSLQKDKNGRVFVGWAASCASESISLQFIHSQTQSLCSPSISHSRASFLDIDWFIKTGWFFMLMIQPHCVEIWSQRTDQRLPREEFAFLVDKFYVQFIWCCCCDR